MELLNFLSQVPIPVLILVIAVLVVVTAVVVYQYAKAKGLDGIRKEVYKLFLHAEHIYKESGQGEKKLKWVVQQARGLLPKWLQVIMSEEVLLKIIDWWFKEVKDLLDDGKVNSSQNLLVYPLGILLCQPVYIWGIRTLCRMEDEDEELYCQDNGMYYEPSKPNYPLVIVLLLMAGIFWPLVILFAVFVPLTFLLMDKMGQLHPKDDDEMDPEEDTYL